MGNFTPIDTQGLYDDGFMGGEFGALDALPHHIPEPEPRYAQLYEATPRIKDPSIVVNALLDLAQFERKDEDLVLEGDFSLTREGRDGQEETYDDIMLVAKVVSGHTDAARYGIGTFGDQKAVLFMHDWSHQAGAMGIIESIKHQKARELSDKLEIPLIDLNNSSGANQYHTTHGLYGMQRNIRGDRRHKQLHISGVGRDYGGSAASEVYGGATTFGFAGGDFGFAGPSLIDAYTRTKGDKRRQGIENAAIDRTIHTVMFDADEAYRWLSKFLHTMRKDTPGVIEKPAIDETDADFTIPGGRTIAVHKVGIAPALADTEDAEYILEAKAPEDPEHEDERQEMVYNFDVLPQAVHRPDAEYMMHAIADEGSLVPLYNHRVYVESRTRIGQTNDFTETFKIEYPAVIASLMRVNGRKVLVIGQQPSYTVKGEDVKRQPSSPEPKDLEYQVELIRDFAVEHKIPLLFLADTPGAKPTYEAESKKLSRRIDEAIEAADEHEEIVISINMGEGGSGGALTSMVIGDFNAMFDTSHSYVAHPTSSASILYKVLKPDNVLKTLWGMRPGAKHQKNLGLSDVTIKTGEPYETGQNTREAVIKAMNELADQDDARRLRRRHKRVMSTKPYTTRKARKSDYPTDEQRKMVLGKLANRK